MAWFRRWRAELDVNTACLLARWLHSRYMGLQLLWIGNETACLVLLSAAAFWVYRDGDAAHGRSVSSGCLGALLVPVAFSKGWWCTCLSIIKW